MTVRTFSTSGVKRYTGLAADVKPTTNTPIGSTFVETDTALTYMFDGAGWFFSGNVAKSEVRSFFDSLGTVVAACPKASPGWFLSVYVTNKNAALRYFQLHNKATAPVNTDVPIMSIPIDAGSATVPGKLSLPDGVFGQGGRFCSVGVSWAISTTEATLTTATAADHDITGSYV